MPWRGEELAGEEHRTAKDFALANVSERRMCAGRYKGQRQDTQKHPFPDETPARKQALRQDDFVER